MPSALGLVRPFFGFDRPLPQITTSLHTSCIKHERRASQGVEGTQTLSLEGKVLESGQICESVPPFNEPTFPLMAPLTGQPVAIEPQASSFIHLLYETITAPFA